MTFIAIVLVGSIISLFFGAALLLLVSKWLKVPNATYKKSVLAIFLLGVGSIIAGIIFAIIDLGIISDILVTIASFIVFHLIFKRYYQLAWTKSLAVYIVFSIISLILVSVIAIPARQFIVTPFVVKGEAMGPVYNEGDYVLINKFDKDFKRGDVIVMMKEQDFFIKRIIGLPGETVEVKEGKVIINGEVLDESYITGDTQGDLSVTLATDQYFVLGDYRSKSLDSRIFGPVSKEMIVGKVTHSEIQLLK